MDELDPFGPSGLSSADRELLRAALRQRGAATDLQITELRRSFHDIVDAVAQTNNDDEHDPEGTTIAFERAQVAALLDQALIDRTHIEAASLDVDHARFGLCRRCGEPIGMERLMAIPFAVRCIRCA